MLTKRIRVFYIGYSIIIRNIMRNNFGKLFFIVTLFLQGCDSERSPVSTVKFWSMGAEAEYVSKLIPQFEKENPQIKINVQQIPWTAAQEKLITAYASDNMPDLFQLGNTWIPQFVILDALEKLDNRIKKSRVVSKENYFEGIWNTNIIENNVYGIPWYIDTRVLFYRKDVLRKAGYSSPPKTWKEFYEISKKIKNIVNDENKYAVYLPTNEWAPYVIFALQNEAELLKQDNCFGNFQSGNFKEAFNYLMKFHKENLAPIGISQVNNVYQAFTDNYFSMYISGPWNIPEFKKWMINGLENEWCTAPLPSPNDNYPGVSLAGGSSLVIFEKSSKKSEAWKFIEYLSRPEVQLEFYRLINDLPAVKKCWNDSTLSNDKYMKAFYTQFSKVTSTPKIAEWEQIAFSKIQQYAEYAARGVMTTDEALGKLDKDVNKILEKRRRLLNKK